LHRVAVVAVVAVVGALGLACGRPPLDRLPDDAAGGVGGVDAAGHDGRDASPDAEDAVVADASCDALHAQAQAAFDMVVAVSRGCAADPDCAVISAPGRCLNGCNYFLSRAAVPAVNNAGVDLCGPFIAAGCFLPALPCPPPLSAACAAGMCVSGH
jgi:hypothetical protein